MLGRRADIGDKDFHFANAAKRFALDAKMFRCRAAIHVENKDDIIFWSAVLKHFRPDDRFHFIAGSRNEFGHETSGVTQCLKYYDFLNKDFFICIDSDYRYLLRERGFDTGHFILQTYTYSFENHHCFADGLDDVCGQVTHLNNTVFDFKEFLHNYSSVIYDLFIWHLYFMNADPTRFTKYDFNHYLNIYACKTRVKIADNVAMALEELRIRVEKRTGYFGRKFPNADLEQVKKKYQEMGLTPETTYLFLRGHNVYDMISAICKDVCKVLLEREKSTRFTREAIANLYRDRNHVDMQLKQNVKYGAYPAIQKIETDIQSLLE